MHRIAELEVEKRVVRDGADEVAGLAAGVLVALSRAPSCILVHASPCLVVRPWGGW